MKLKEIHITTKIKNSLEIKKSFIELGNFLTSIYYEKLKKIETTNTAKIIIELHQNLNEKAIYQKSDLNRFSDDEIKKIFVENNYFYQNCIEQLLDVTIIHRRFDFEKWYLSDNLIKNSMILNQLHEGMLQLANYFDWKTEMFFDIYKNIDINEITKKLN